MYKIIFTKDFDDYIISYIIISLSIDETVKVIGFSSMPFSDVDDILTTKKLNRFTESNFIAFKNYAATLNINIKDFNIILDSIKMLD